MGFVLLGQTMSIDSRLALLSSSSNPKSEREQEDKLFEHRDMTVCRGLDSGQPAAGIELNGAVTPPYNLARPSGVEML